MFNVGDKVRVIKDCAYGLDMCNMCPQIGHVGIITIADAECESVNLDNWEDEVSMYVLELVARQQKSITSLPLPG